MPAPTPPPHVTQHWHVTKPGATGAGMVCAQAREAAEAGAAMLRAGGSAADAAVACAFALAAVEPWNSGLGGIGFCQVAEPGGAVETLDFGPVAPAELDPRAFALTGRDQQDLFGWPEVAGDANLHGPLSFVIPAAVAGCLALHERHGRLPLAEVLTPAVELARRGLAQDWFTTLKIAGSAAVLRLYEASARLYLPGGLPPVPPHQGAPGFLPLGNLAATLERLREAGLRDFYQGEVARALVADVRAMGGCLSAADLRGCRAVFRPSLAVPWRGRTLHLASGLTAAPTMREVLRDLAAVPFGPRPDAAWYAALARALRAGYARRLEALGEEALGETEPVAAASCTSHLTAADADGRMVAMTTTLLSSMGSRVVLPATGVLMNNGVMWFDPRPGSPNAIAPGKRPLCNMSPLVALDAAGRPELAMGASGGRRILAAVLQMLCYVADFGMSPDEAAHHPRLDVSRPSGVTADARLGAEVLAALAADAAVLAVEHAVLPANFACPNLIQRQGAAWRGIADAMSPWSAAVAA